MRWLRGRGTRAARRARKSDDAAITRAIVAMAHNLRLRVVAEGVETAEQLAFLDEVGCDEVQGYYFSKPVPTDEFREVVLGWRDAAPARYATGRSNGLHPVPPSQSAGVAPGC
jgi:sensor c-di-GMP phosphodiesterase-like protein